MTKASSCFVAISYICSKLTIKNNIYLGCHLESENNYQNKYITLFF